MKRTVKHFFSPSQITFIARQCECRVQIQVISPAPNRITERDKVMARNYIGGDMVKFRRKDLCLVDAEYYNGECLENLEPRRLFPMSGLSRYIALLDSEGTERAIIRDLDTLMPESREAILACLNEYYLIPKITSIKECIDKFGLLKWSVTTDKGDCDFTIRNRHSDIKLIYGKRVLMKDSSDNRYEIPDYTQLDHRSIHLLNSYL